MHLIVRFDDRRRRLIRLVVICGFMIAAGGACSSELGKGNPGSAGDGAGTGGLGGGGAAAGAAGTGTGGRAGGGADAAASCRWSVESCGTTAYCAFASWNGHTILDECLPIPSGCTSCDCLISDLSVAFKQASPNQGVPPCGCVDAQFRPTDGGATPPVLALCNGV